MQINGVEQTAESLLDLAGIGEPKGFREWLVNKYPDCDGQLAWERVPGSIKAEFKEK